MLGNRRRTGYSLQQPSLISYKIRGGKGSLYEDGMPVPIKMESIKVG